jgi:hypothetical protein
MDALNGAIAAVLASFLAALFLALTFRLPVPFVGMLGPMGELSPLSMGLTRVVTAVAVAWLFYGVLGGFVVLALVGAIAGHAAAQRSAGTASKNRTVIVWASLASIVPVAILSTVDYAIGPW